VLWVKTETSDATDFTDQTVRRDGHELPPSARSTKWAFLLIDPSVRDEIAVRTAQIQKRQPMLALDISESREQPAVTA
jgi:hypothetical protein